MISFRNPMIRVVVSKSVSTVVLGKEKRHISRFVGTTPAWHASSSHDSDSAQRRFHHPPYEQLFRPHYGAWCWNRRLSTTGSGATDDLLVAKSDLEGDQTMTTLPGSQTGGKKLAIVFTCTVCDTRSAKQFTENAYRNGVVIVQCPGCNSRHLIADNLGYFEDERGGWNIEKNSEKAGVTVVNDENVMELTLEDVCGSDAISRLAQSEQQNDK